jgi:ABC-type dipeptide/oligopeptide/nickel transport system ATPase component
VNPPSGCRFNPRCQLRAKLDMPVRCADEEPLLGEFRDGHLVACHFAEDAVRGI